MSSPRPQLPIADRLETLAWTPDWPSANAALVREAAGLIEALTEALETVGYHTRACAVEERRLGPRTWLPQCDTEYCNCPLGAALARARQAAP